MEKERIQFGLYNHFPRHQWLKDTDYFEKNLSAAEVDLKIHGPTVRTAFQNIIAFLKSIHIRDTVECEELYASILSDDSNNLNALVGLYDLYERTERSRKKAAVCLERINSIINPGVQNRAIPKALLEIGLALCLLIPRYQSDDRQSVENKQQTNFAPTLNDYQNLDFITDAATLDFDLYIGCNSAQKKRVYSSIRYLQEGLGRFAEVQTQHDKPDVLVWKYFLGKSYNRFWVPVTRGSRKLRKDFTLKSLECFCEIILALNQGEDKYNRMYYHRCLAYIGQILTSKKNIIMHGEEGDFVPECFWRVRDNFLRGIWDNPTDAITRAMHYGYDPVVYTINAKHLLHEGKLDSAIEMLDKIFNADSSIHTYAAVIRMRAFKRKHKQCFNDALAAGDFSTLTPTFLIEAEKCGNYWFDTTDATETNLSTYATILHWLGTFPDGKKVTNRKKIRTALYVLDRIYKEEGCQPHYSVHKKRAECHADLTEMDEAIKYIIWSINACPDSPSKPSIAFKLLIEYLLIKLKQYTASMLDEQKTNMHKQMKYYIEVEIKRCHDLIKNAEGQLGSTLINTAKLLLDTYNKTILDQVKYFVSNESSAEAKQFVEELDERYSIIFRNISGWCRNYPEQIKSFLDFIANLKSLGSIQTMVTMSLICLGRQHTNWTRDFNRKWKVKPENRNVFQLCSPSLDCLQNISRYDYLVIHAPEDKEWVFYVFLPEMEDRPKTFKGCVPDRDFLRGDSFEKNIERCLQMTSKVVLVITSKFFERVYDVLKRPKIIATLENMHAERIVDVIVLFLEEIQLDKTKYSQLMKFENIDASGPYLNWNCLRMLIVQQLPPEGTKRPPVIWEGAGDEAHVRPRENDDDKYTFLEEDILPYGVPEAVYILHRSAYIVGYDGALKVPRWVAHKIDRETPRDEGIVSKKTHKNQLRTYHPDRGIPSQASSAEVIYNRADITQEHVTPLTDHSSTVELAMETNVMTNMMPELKNHFLWNQLEEYCRDNLTKDFDTIYVISGTLFISKTDDIETNNRNQGELSTPVSKVIGGNEVAVPTHFYKVIVAKNSNEKDKEPCIGAFMVPNEPLYDAELEDLRVSISQLESWLGIDLFRNMRSDMKEMSFPTLPTAFFPKDYRMRKMIQYTDTLDGLQSIWKDLSNELKHELQTDYEEKKTHLMKKS